MSDYVGQKASKVFGCGDDMVLLAGADDVGCRILIPPYGGSNPPAPAKRA
jgi:hypothetical protein